MSLPKLPDMNLTFVSVLYPLSGVLRIAMCTLYRIKFLSRQEVNINLIDSISYVDKYLQCIGVKVSHRRDQIVCTVYAVGMLGVLLPLGILYLTATNMTKHFQMVSALNSAASIAIKIIIQFSLSALLTHFTIFLYIVKQRLSTVRRALKKIENTEDQVQMTVAWVRNETPDRSIDDIIRRRLIRRGLITRNRENIYKHIRIISSCLNEVFCKLNEFYVYFFRCNFVAFVFFTAISSAFTVLKTDYKQNVMITGVVIVEEFIAIWLCSGVTRELREIDKQLSRRYLTHQLENTSASNVRVTEKHLYQCAHRRKDFDCGYVTVDMKLIPILYDFVTLFLFAMIP